MSTPVRVSPAPSGCSCPAAAGFGASKVHLTGNPRCALAVPAQRHEDPAYTTGREYVLRHHSHWPIHDWPHERRVIQAMFTDPANETHDVIGLIRGAVDALLEIRGATR